MVKRAMGIEKTKLGKRRIRMRPKRAALRFLRWMGFTIMNPVYLAIDLSRPFPAVKQGIDINIRRTSGEGLGERLEGVDSLLASQCECSRALGNRCYLAEYRSDVAGYLWVDTGAIHLDFRRLGKLPQKHAYLYHLNVLKKYSGKGILQGLIMEACNDLYSEGYIHGCAIVTNRRVNPYKRVFLGRAMSRGRVLIVKLPLTRWQLAFPSLKHFHITE